MQCLSVLIEQGVHIPLLFTHADDPGESQWFGSVAQLAAAHGIRTVTPDSANTPEWVGQGRDCRPDFVFSFYYRHMLANEWLAVPRKGALNMHGSLLPRYRGRAPVHWAILNGETETGASLHYMLEKPDAGALVDQEAVPILIDDDALAVSLKVAQAAQAVLRRSLPRLIAGTAAATPLDLARGSYFGRRRPEDGRIDWRRGARAVHDLVRAVAPPFPGAFSDIAGVRAFVLETRLADGPALHPSTLPCLYAQADGWYADCADGRRLQITRLEVGGKPILANDPSNAWPSAWSNQPILLN